MEHPRNVFVNARLVSRREATDLNLLDVGTRHVREDWRCILYQAADILEHLGWCRDALEQGNRHCAVGAIIAAYNHGDVKCKDLTESVFLDDPQVERVIEKVQRQLHGSLMDWNDTTARSARGVAALLRTTAAHR
jgi:hypothetical protein